MDAGKIQPYTITCWGLGSVQWSTNASSVNHRDSSSSIPFTPRNRSSRFCTTVKVGSRTGDGGAGGSISAGRGACFRDILSPRLAATDLGFVTLDYCCSMTARDGVGVGSLFSSVGIDVDWEKNMIRNWGVYWLGVSLQVMWNSLASHHQVAHGRNHLR